MLTAATITERVREALREDAPWGDLTARVAIREDAVLSAELNAREPGVFAGGEVFAAAFRELDPRVAVQLLARDGDAFVAGQVLARVSGPARSVLTAERIALNFTQRMSGIATLTARFVAETSGTRARIADTRKTTPGLRAFEKHAVRAGGGTNHRFGLSDAVMIKDNHLAALGAVGPEEVTAALR
ncbi:carboxylating nicotinate-nucleotide diphosphorylase, partial [Leucobacter sp. M11]|uniref:carboxylating nicotinate-nucleotide diphosphorylase n=1 Tax=Leucobacter sp. M11 TaxID=2993565 RepID=UPI002D7F3BA8